MYSLCYTFFCSTFRFKNIKESEVSNMFNMRNYELNLTTKKVNMDYLDKVGIII